MPEDGGGEVCSFKGHGKESFTDKVTFRRHLRNVNERAGGSLGEHIGKGNSQCKGPVAELCMASSRHGKE